MEQSKTKKESLPKKKYEYITITQQVQKISIEDCKEGLFDIEDELDLESTQDDCMTIFLRISQMRNLKEKEYLVLKMMGYEFFEMPEILGIKNLSGVYQVGNKMKGSFAKIDKELLGF